MQATFKMLDFWCTAVGARRVSSTFSQLESRRQLISITGSVIHVAMPLAGTQQPAVGSRVLLGGQHRATVRYVGPVEGQEGAWVGIEYDEAGRGKHDGSHGGRRYFECAQGQPAGSFVRLGKFAEAAYAGRSLLAAAAERYGGGDDGEGSPTGSDGGPPRPAGEAAAAAAALYVTTSGNRRVAVEVVAPPDASRGRGAGGAAAAVAVLAQQGISSLVRRKCDAVAADLKTVQQTRQLNTGCARAVQMFHQCAAAHVRPLRSPVSCRRRVLLPLPHAGRGGGGAGAAALPGRPGPQRQPDC